MDGKDKLNNQETEEKLNLNKCLCRVVGDDDDLQIMAISIDPDTKKPITAQKVFFSPDGKTELSRTVVDLNTAFDQMAEYADKHPLENNDKLKSIGLTDKYLQKTFIIRQSSLDANDYGCTETLCFCGGHPPEGKYPAQRIKIDGKEMDGYTPFKYISRNVTDSVGFKRIVSLNRTQENEIKNCIHDEMSRIGNPQNINTILTEDPFVAKYNIFAKQKAIDNRNNCEQALHKWKEKNPIKNFFSTFIPNKTKNRLQANIIAADKQVQNSEENLINIYNNNEGIVSKVRETLEPVLNTAGKFFKERQQLKVQEDVLERMQNDKDNSQEQNRRGNENYKKTDIGR